MKRTIKRLGQLAPLMSLVACGDWGGSFAARPPPPPTLPAFDVSTLTAADPGSALPDGVPSARGS